MHAVLETVKPNHNAKFFCLCVFIPRQAGLSVKTKLVSNRNTLNYTSLELSDLSFALRVSFPIQHRSTMLVVSKMGNICFKKKNKTEKLSYKDNHCIFLLLFLRLRPFLPFLVFLSFRSLLSFLSLVSLLFWPSHKQLSGKHFLSSSSRGQAAPLLAACMRM